MRRTRKYSKTGLYHIVIRGVNKQNLFFQDEDRRLFLSLVKKYSIRYEIKIYAYCLMDNHVHFELDDSNKKVSVFMQVLCSVYARLFNKKYDRIGHLFQDRFASEVIEDDTYFLTVFRYILQNPLVAGICKINQYPWSSYHCYEKKSTFIEKRRLFSYFSCETEIYDFLMKKSSDICLEIELRPSEREKNNIEIIKRILQSENPIINPELPKQIIKQKIRQMKDVGLSIRTISRITGIEKYLVFVS